MVGLTEVKTVIDNIIASYKMQKMRNGYLKNDAAYSRHMIFTGNPGSAKTTVARLVAKILKNEGVLETGGFVECGRADLIGRYVGWTTPAAKKAAMRIFETAQNTENFGNGRFARNVLKQSEMRQSQRLKWALTMLMIKTPPDYTIDNV